MLTDLRRKEIAQSIGALETELQGLEDKKWEWLCLEQESQAVRPDDEAARTPEKAGEAKKSPAKRHRGGDAEAAAELLLILRLLWQTLQQQSKP